MAVEISADQFIKKLKAHRSEVELKKIQRYFKSSAGQSGGGDEFIGVRMGQVFALAKEFIEMPPKEINQASRQSATAASIRKMFPFLISTR